MKRLDLGDLYVLDTGALGLEVRDRSNDKLKIFLNQGGELALMEWLQEKYPEGRKTEGVAKTFANSDPE